MKSKHLLLTAIFFLQIIPASIAATDATVGGQQYYYEQWDFWTHLISALYTLVPIILIGGILMWILRGHQRGTAEYLKRSQEHMQRQDQLLERIALALERKDNAP